VPTRWRGLRHLAAVNHWVVPESIVATDDVTCTTAGR
jgi:hypothetical protein